MTTEATENKELTAAIAEVEAATAAVEPVVEQSDLAKALGSAIDRLEALAKGDFGDTSKAHNGNALDKSAPTGSGSTSGGYPTADSEENKADAGRVKASGKVHAKTAAPSKVLTKGDTDEDDDDDDDDESKKGLALEELQKKSQSEVTEDKILKNLTTGDGSDEYMQVVEASDAIAHQADVFAKAISDVSAQVAALSKSVHLRIDTLQKSQTTLAEGAAVLLKSQAQLTKDTEVLKKAPAIPASGIVVIAPKSGDDKSTTSPTLTELAKSVAKAIQAGTVHEEVGGRILAKLSSQSPDEVWKTIPQQVREAIGGAGTK